MKTDRRNFVATMFAVAGVGLPDRFEIPEEIPSGDFGILMQILSLFPSDRIAFHLSRMETLDAKELRRRLRREVQKEKRAARRRQQQERHAGDTVVYRGPCLVPSRLLDGRDVVSSRGRRMLACTASSDLRIIGIRKGCPDGFALVERDGYPIFQSLEDDSITESTSRDILIREGSRLLFDLRRGVPSDDVWCIEFIRTADGRHCLHAWSGRDRLVDVEDIPVLRGGVVIDTSPNFGNRLNLKG